MVAAKKKTSSGIAEQLKNLGKDFFEQGKDAIRGARDDVASQLLDDNFDSPDIYGENPFLHGARMGSKDRKEPIRVIKSEVLFNRQEVQEKQSIRQELNSLIENVRRELELLKVQDKGLSEDISKLVLQNNPEKPGIYHIRFFQFVIKLLSALRKRISEGRMWLDVAFEKKKKKKFWSLAKKKGTSFSRSSELSQSNLPG
ncbi:hypothetical protein COU88_03740 [Candidatus Roizmanbacteria bacterium CG10_big_fil_rev_8_21_14_0_10_39_6]|uniref:DUF5660 domain-containing protein n=1 Tax=Candidatus Roizmanbacteria bacterium CG10_big_fil_rev_8_21_14_0_10_39_6 TaxID=1974853 RepID=A0A2M8KS00_9BACT|nr:MAG: hypothetical protein COU88_03740 [Candidatus Roizmanbacteria bacterium CG10_big_fil_rev_8_21_14_0_10_39_6]